MLTSMYAMQVSQRQVAALDDIVVADPGSFWSQSAIENFSGHRGSWFSGSFIG